MKVETIKTVPVPLSIEMIDVQDSECLTFECHKIQ
jgi:hypothetical protein